MTPSSSSLNREMVPTHTVNVDLPANTKYLSHNRISQHLIRKFMRTFVELIEGLDVAKILDVGCGEGIVTRQLCSMGLGGEIHGVDIELGLLKVAKQVAPSASYVASSIYNLPVAARTYDLVICTEVLEHLEHPLFAIQEIERITRHYCIFSVPHEPWWRIANVARGSYWLDLGNTPGHVNHWNQQAFIGFVNNCLDVINIRQSFPWIIVLGRVHSSPRQ